MQHAPGFLKVVNDAKSRVKETNVDEVKQKLDRGEKLIKPLSSASVSLIFKSPPVATLMVPASVAPLPM